MSEVWAQIANDLDAEVSMIGPLHDGQLLNDALRRELFRTVSSSIRKILATQPEPAAVPELPPYVKHHEGGWYRIEFANGDSDLMDANCDPDDLDRIAEAASILAARRRAGL